MDWLKAGLISTLISALLLVAALILLSFVQKGFDARSVLTLVLLGLPLALVAAAPICLVILPVADALLDLSGRRSFGVAAMIGAVAGVVVPLFVMFVLHVRPPGMIGTITALLILAGAVSGGTAGLFYAELAARRAS